MFLGVLIVFWSVDNGVQQINKDYQNRLARLREKRFANEAVSKANRPAMRRIQQVSKRSNGFPESFGPHISGLMVSINPAFVTQFCDVIW